MKRREAEQILKVSLDSEKTERKRIAADLHDSVAADLSAIKNYLSLLQKNNKDLNAVSGFGEIKESVENALENTRLISYKLMPPLLETFGLIAALEDNFERLRYKTSIAFVLSCDKPPVLSTTIAYELFRIIQEFTTNMVKYGNISACHIRVYESAEQVSIDIKDDGSPYDFFASMATAKGTGLLNICSRLKVIDSQLTQHEASEGNHFTITLKK